MKLYVHESVLEVFYHTKLCWPGRVFRRSVEIACTHCTVFSHCILHLTERYLGTQEHWSGSPYLIWAETDSCVQFQRLYLTVAQSWTLLVSHDLCSFHHCKNMSFPSHWAMQGKKLTMAGPETFGFWYLWCVNDSLYSVERTPPVLQDVYT